MNISEHFRAVRAKERREERILFKAGSSNQRTPRATVLRITIPVGKGTLRNRNRGDGVVGTRNRKKSLVRAAENCETRG